MALLLINVEQKWKAIVRPGPYAMVERKKSYELIFEYAYNPILDMVQVCFLLAILFTV